MKKCAKILLGILFVALCAIFPCAVVFGGTPASANSGIYVEDGSLEINGGVMQGNTDKAITINGGTHTIENVTISGSTNGAIIINGGAKVTLDNVVIAGNSNTDNGGAVVVGEGATLVVKNSVIKNNDEGKKLNLWTSSGDGELIDYIRCEDEIKEAQLVISKIKIPSFSFKFP